MARSAARALQSERNQTGSAADHVADHDSGRSPAEPGEPRDGGGAVPLIGVTHGCFQVPGVGFGGSLVLDVPRHRAESGHPSRGEPDDAFTITDPGTVARIAAVIDGLHQLTDGTYSFPAETHASGVVRLPIDTKVPRRLRYRD